MSKSVLNDASLKKLQITKFADATGKPASDNVSVEEPLEIRLGWSKSEPGKVIAVTMRTPGEDRELAAGFLFTEGIVSDASEILDIKVQKCNVVNVYLKEGVEVDSASLERHSFVASSCGVCGKKSIAAVRVKRCHNCVHDVPIVSPAVVHAMPGTLRSYQANFDVTGGIHASCLFDIDGKLLALQEDVGRHNALDKLLGRQFLDGALPLTDKILMVSGRASFELVQKAAHAGLPMLAAVGAPSSLAVQLAEECDMTLLGFVREERFNIYSGAQRIAGS